MKLDGKVAYVTGGAMGNGLGIVKMFLKYGATVIIADYNERVFEVEEVLREKGYPVKAYHLDIRDARSVQQSVEEVIKEYERIDILVNNAGVCKLKPFLEMTEEDRDYHFGINIDGTWNVTHAIVPYMVKNRYGKIINLSSVTGVMVADPGEAAYATTKAALVGFTIQDCRDTVLQAIYVSEAFALEAVTERLGLLKNGRLLFCSQGFGIFRIRRRVCKC